MQDMREVVYDLVVNQLGVRRPLAGWPARDGLRPDLAGSRCAEPCARMYKWRDADAARQYELTEKIALKRSRRTTAQT